MSKYSKEKFYWLRLEKDFFKQRNIVLLESLPNGKEYELFFLKLMAESIDREGYLRVNDLIPYDADMLGAITNTSPDTVGSAIEALKALQLIYVMDDKTIFIEAVQLRTGNSTVSAEDKRIQRKKREKLLAESSEVDKGWTNCPPEYRDKSIEYINNIYTLSDNSDIPYAQIIEYLNEKCGTHYRTSTQKTRNLIKARYNEGFDESDFFTVIDKMVSKWKNDSTMNRYLRPETLFSPKFESYLNEPVNHDESLSAELDAWSEGAEVFCGPF